ncbi:MAG: SDR family oxidoreductase [Bacteroidia bacterium]|nr:SDR family oxidoreductase [Bacteroidia bacterium]
MHTATADPSPTLLVLGGSSDIGRAIAHRYAQAGYTIWLAGRQSHTLAADTEDIRIRYGVSVQVFVFDALAYDTHPAFFEQLPYVPDTICWAVGLLGDQETAAHDPAQAILIAATNYTGAVSALGIAASLLEAQGRGTLIGISSVAGDRGRGSNYLYGSAKAGLTAFLSGLRNRLAASGIQVLTVKPGFVDTAMTAGLPLPAPLTAQPAEVARAVYHAAQKKRHTVYVKPVWRWIMLIIKLIPEPIFMRLRL